MFFFGEGVGVYEGEIEDSHVVVGVVRDEEALTRLRETLDRLCGMYQQDAIALVTGDVEFRHG